MKTLPEYEPSSTPPKLFFYALPSKPKEPPGLLTPPLNTLASIPFQWEEAPGKPRSITTTTTPPHKTAARCLELPPRLLTESKITKVPSPTTVLDGPYVTRSSSHTPSNSFRKWSLLGGGLRYKMKRDEREERSANFGSWRWGSSSGGGGLKMQNRGMVGDSFEFSSSYVSGGDGESDNCKVTMARLHRRRSSFLSFSHTSSNMWMNIYESFKQAAPWRRR